MSTVHYHGVDTECAFLDGVGSWSEAGHKFTRRHLLEGYLRGLSQRIFGFTDAQKQVLRDRVAILLRRAE